LCRLIDRHDLPETMRMPFSFLSTTRFLLRQLAQTGVVLAMGAQMQLAAAQNLAFDVPAQPLEQSLRQFARQARLQLVFPPELTQGMNAPTLQGQFSVEVGLQALLQGTDLRGTVQGDTLSITRRPARPSVSVSTLPEVVVSAGDQYVNLLPTPYAGGQVAKGVRLGVLGNTSHMAAPFSTTSYTSEAVSQQQASTVAEAINRDPSVRYTVLPGGNVDNLFIRGFPIWEGNSGEIAFDGIYGVAPNYRVRTEYVDRIEVVKGPGALLFGMSPNGSVGGVINIAPKRANENVARLTTSLSSDSLVRGHVDVGRRLGDEAQYGIRINSSYYAGDTGADHQSMEGGVFAAALDYEGERFRSTLDLLAQNEDIDGVGRPIMPSGVTAMPQAPDGSLNVTQPWEWSKNRERAVVLRTEFDVNRQLTVFANVGKSTADVQRVYDSAPRLVSAAGDTNITPTYASFDVDRSTVDAGLRSRIQTGGVRHSVTLQTALYEEDFHRVLSPGLPVQSNIYAPVAYPAQTIARPGALPRIHNNRNTSVALVDTMQLLDERLQVSLGLRRQRIESTNFNLHTSAPSNHYDESVTTPALGVVFRPASNWSVYANHIEGLSKGDIAPPAASNYGEVLAPYKSKQYELGTKYDFGAFMATAALFQIEKPSAGLIDGRYALNGEQRNRGLELYGYGQVSSQLRLLGGITFIDSTITRSSNPALVGNRPIGSARMQANLGAEWDLPGVPGLTLLGDMTHTGRQFVNQTNSLEIPAWTRIDMGARYATRWLGRKTTLRASVQNLTNRNAWVGVTSWGAVSAQIPRTYVVSASFDF